MCNFFCQSNCGRTYITQNLQFLFFTRWFNFIDKLYPFCRQMHALSFFVCGASQLCFLLLIFHNTIFCSIWCFSFTFCDTVFFSTLNLIVCVCKLIGPYPLSLIRFDYNVVFFLICHLTFRVVYVTFVLSTLQRLK